MRSFVPVFVVLAALSAPAARAESSTSCAGFITTLPATISTPGTWCLGANLGTGLTSGNAIAITSPNVTLDCNGFRIQANVAANTTIGIRADTQLNATVRNCTVRGFYYGMYFNAGGGHLIEDNRFDGSIVFGVVGFTDGIVIRRNLVSETGIGTPNISAGIYGGGGAVDIVGNTVDGVYGHPTAAYNPIGIAVVSGAGRLEGNIVRNVVDPTAGTSTAISVNGTGRMSVIGNDMIHSQAGSLWYGLRCSGSPSTQVLMRNNTATGFKFAFAGCADAGDNLAYTPF